VYKINRLAMQSELSNIAEKMGRSEEFIVFKHGDTMPPLQ